MVLPDNIELKLYVLTELNPNSSQYEESQKVLKFIDGHGVRNRFKIDELDDKVGNKDFFWMMINPEQGKLPYLEYVHMGSGTYDGYAGQEDIVDKLIELGLPQNTDDQQ